MPFDEYELRTYVAEIRYAGVLDEELKRIREVMVGNLKNPEEDAAKQRETVIRLNQLFKVLLAEKARQDALKQVGNDNSSNTQDTSTRVAHDPRPRIRIWNILQ